MTEIGPRFVFCHVILQVLNPYDKYCNAHWFIYF